MAQFLDHELLVDGRVEFHLNGGFTKVSFWMGGQQTIDIATSSIPIELRKIGSWLSLRLSSDKGCIVEGPGRPDPYTEAWMKGEKRPVEEV